MTSKLKEGVMQGVFTLCACVSILAVALIARFTSGYVWGFIASAVSVLSWIGTCR